MFRNSLVHLPTILERPDQQPNGAGLRRLCLLPVDWISKFSKTGIELAVGIDGPIEVDVTSGEPSFSDSPGMGASGVYYQPSLSAIIPKTREDLTAFFFQTAELRWIALHVDRNNICRVSGSPEFPLRMNFSEGVSNKGGKNGYTLSLSGAQPEPSLVVPSVTGEFFTSTISMINFVIADNRDIQVYRGDTFGMPLKIADKVNGGFVAFIGSTFKMQLRNSSNVDVITFSSELGSIVLTDSDQVIRINGTAEQMAALSPGSYSYDLQWKLPSGEIKTLLKGRFIVIQDVTN